MTTCRDIQGLLEAVHAIMYLRDTLERWLHGKPTEQVQLGGVAVPTLRGLIAAIDERESKAAQEAIREGVAEVVALKNQVTDIEAAVAAQVLSLKGISPAATQLPEGAPPTAAYDPETGVLALGIPAGQTGARGPAGPPGQAPVIDTIECGGAYAVPLTILDGGNAACPEE